MLYTMHKGNNDELFVHNVHITMSDCLELYIICMNEVIGEFIIEITFICLS